MGVHALVLVLVKSWTPEQQIQLDREAEVTADADSIRARSLDPSCVANVALANSARMVYCTTPFAGAPEACVKQAVEDFRLGMLACDRPLQLASYVENQPVSVALVEPEVLDKIKPQPLLPLLDPKDQKEFEKKLQEQVEEKHEEIKKEETRKVPSGQVVEITKPKIEARPDNARYVSEYDSRVDKETVARGSTEEMVERPGPRELPPSANPLAPPRPDTPPPPAEPDAIPSLERRESPGALSMRKPGLPETEPAPPIPESGVRNGSDEAPSPDGLTPRRGQRFTESTREAPSDQTGHGGEGPATAPPTVPDLRPSQDMLSRVVGGGSVDKLDGVESGETTALNAKRWKYATFFNRMKRQVAQNWHPDQVYLRRDPTGNIYGPKDRITILKVALKRDGSVARIYISKASGVDFLDDEAVRAFQAAQPFPNPPIALVDDHDQLITFSFGFHFQIGSRRESWKIFRYR